MIGSLVASLVLALVAIVVTAKAGWIGLALLGLAVLTVISGLDPA